MYLSKRTLRIFIMISFVCIIIGISTALFIDSFETPVLSNSSNAVYPPSASYVADYQNGMTVTAKAAILMDVSTGTILYGKNEQLRRDPASTTKVMTAVLAMELGNPEDIVTVSSKAAWTIGSSLDLRTGDQISMEQLMKGMLLRSGNDSAVAIAEYIAGSVSKFGDMMTARAKQLGALNSRFRNPHGLTAVNHYSTAYDLAMITKHALTFQAFKEAVSSKQTTLTYIDGRVQSVQNTNKLLWQLWGADGVKTGTTSAAGQCLISSATRDSWQLVAVVLASRSRWNDSSRLLEYGFSTFCPVTLAEKDEKITQIDILYGRKPSVDIITAKDLSVVVRKTDRDNISIIVDIPQDITAPVKEGTNIGKLVAVLDESQIASVDLIAGSTVRKANIFSRLIDYIFH